eukprot:767894-Hanusia_phi.AAC.4
MVGNKFPASPPLRHVSLLMPQDVHDRLEDAGAQLVGMLGLSDVVEVAEADVLDRSCGLHVEPAHVEVQQQLLLPLSQARVCPVEPHPLYPDPLRHSQQDLRNADDDEQGGLFVEAYLRLLHLLARHQEVTDRRLFASSYRHLVKRLEVLQALPYHHWVRKPAEDSRDDVEAAGVGEGEGGASELGELLEQGLERRHASHAHLAAELDDLKQVREGAADFTRPEGRR